MALQLADDSFKEHTSTVSKLLKKANIIIDESEDVISMREMAPKLFQSSDTNSPMGTGLFATALIKKNTPLAIFAGKIMTQVRKRSDLSAFVINNGKMLVPRSENNSRFAEFNTCIDGESMKAVPGLNAGAFNHSCYQANCTMTEGLCVQYWSFHDIRSRTFSFESKAFQKPYQNLPTGTSSCSSALSGSRPPHST
jgi:hypothetical protein